MSRKCKFSKDWLSTHKWLEEVKDDQGKAKCKLCNSVFSIANKGAADLKQHLLSRTHQSNESAAANTASIDKLLESKVSQFVFVNIYANTLKMELQRARMK